ncbi:MAG: DUF3047 domain-containing protein [Gemmatimonadota bacterium]|nr:MAG: DUF3047 domain-containing protein [Gemmatimonadota bacterium]
MEGKLPTLASLLGVAATAIVADVAHLCSQEPVPTLRAQFDEGRLEGWRERKLAGRANRFSVADDAGNPVLEVESRNSASALWRELEVRAAGPGSIAWRWKVTATIRGNDHERERRGDDFAARFFVIFDSDPFSREARAICYVWASSEPIGSTFRNPYFRNVVTIVLQSGDDRAGYWMMEQRDAVSDYRDAFGEPPKHLSAVAVMVDTDNTKSSTTAWFDDISVN